MKKIKFYVNINEFLKIQYYESSEIRSKFIYSFMMFKEDNVHLIIKKGNFIFWNFNFHRRLLLNCSN